MKNATRNAETLRALHKSLLKDGKPAAMARLDPLKALVRGAMSAGVGDARADEAMKAIDREFVTLNELRVATPLEIEEMLGPKYPDIERRVELITRDLNAIFEKEHTLSLDRLRTLSKRDARQFLRDLPLMTPFVEAYVTLFGFENAAAFPVDAETLAMLREQGLFDEKTTLEEAQKFVESNLKSEAECYELFALLRRVVFAPAKKSKSSN